MSVDCRKLALWLLSLGLGLTLSFIVDCRKKLVASKSWWVVALVALALVALWPGGPGGSVGTVAQFEF